MIILVATYHGAVSGPSDQLHFFTLLPLISMVKIKGVGFIF